MAADAELVAVQVTEGELADETCGLFGDLSGAFDCSQSCSRTDDGRSTRGPHISTTGLFRVSRDPKRTGSLAKLTGTDILRACNRSWNDDRCPIRGAYDAACGDANVPVYDRTKRRCYRLHPQPTLAKASLPVPLRFSSPGREGVRSPRHTTVLPGPIITGMKFGRALNRLTSDRAARARPMCHTPPL